MERLRSNKQTLLNQTLCLRVMVLHASNVLVFAPDLDIDVLLTHDARHAQIWILDSGASFHVTPHRD